MEGKMKRILMLTAGNIDHASSRIRAFQYIPMLKHEGYQVKWIPRIPIKNDNSLNLDFFIRKRIFTINRLFTILFIKYNIIFIQRIYISKLLLIILKLKKSRIIYDFDDAIYLDERDKIKTNNTIRLSNYIIVSNSYLKDYVKEINTNVSIITTPIDTEKFTPKEIQTENTGFNIGWIGSYWTTKYLEKVIEPIRELSKEYPIKLILVGADKKFKVEGINIEHLEWTIETENVNIQKFDVGIMPLTNDKFAEGKGGYKILQYMATGIPTIASPVGINKEIVEEGKTGFLAETPQEWKEFLQLLIQNKILILQLGKNARTLAMNRYSREVCFNKLSEILKIE